VSAAAISKFGVATLETHLSFYHFRIPPLILVRSTPMDSSSSNASPPPSPPTLEERLLHLEQRLIQQAKEHKDTVDALKAQLDMDDERISTPARHTTLEVYQELINVYPPIMPHNFYHSEIDPKSSPYKMSDFHFTDWMDYHSPPLAEFDAAKSLSSEAKVLDRELASLQGKLAHITRPLDTYAHETVKRNGQYTEEGERGLRNAAHVRLMLGDLASQISTTRKRHILAALNIHLPATKEPAPIITTEEAAEARRHFDSLNAAATPVKQANKRQGKGKSWKYQQDRYPQQEQQQQQQQQKQQKQLNQRERDDNSRGRSEVRYNKRSENKPRSKSRQATTDTGNGRRDSR